MYREPVSVYGLNVKSYPYILPPSLKLTHCIITEQFCLLLCKWKYWASFWFSRVERRTKPIFVVHMYVLRNVGGSNLNVAGNFLSSANQPLLYNFAPLFCMLVLRTKRKLQKPYKRWPFKVFAPLVLLTY